MTQVAGGSRRPFCGANATEVLRYGYGLVMNRTFHALVATALLGGVAALASASPAASQEATTTRPICFPVEGGASAVRWSDTWGASRDGGARTHQGQDLMGPKMTPLVSAVDGTVREIVFQNDKGNRVVVQDDDGWFYVYLHVNNDTPGTDDMAATRDQAFVPGLAVGQRVTKCQRIAYLGDSGNAEGSGAHLHFEIRQPVTSGDPTRSWAWSSAIAINPADSLRAASGSTSTSSGSTGSIQTVTSTKWSPFATATELVDRQYLDFYGRAADSGGRTYWTGRLTSGVETPASFIGKLLAAPEFEARIAPVARLYWAYFDRIPDTDGLKHWIGRTGSGTTLGQVSQAFAGSAEFTAMYGSLSNDDFVRLVYRNVLDREPDAAGLQHWTGRLAAGVSRGDVMVGFSESPEYTATLRSKVRVVLAYVAMLQRSPDPGGLDHWASRGADALVPGIFASEEYKARIAQLR